MTPDKHRAQLRICHEPIAVPRALRLVRRRQFCSLTDVRWCYNCDYYVCSIHVQARHVGHRMEE